jgi:hypothetical protein
MTVSAAKLQANRNNSKRSTGPRTERGKCRSRLNSLKHGLCAATLVPEDLQLVSERANQWFFAVKPRNSYQAWMVDRIAVASLRIERGERMERRHRDREMLRAETTWDADRKREAEALGVKLCKRPSQVGEQLRATPQGCDWLIARWAELARSAEANSSWTEGQNHLAFDLLGVHPECRDGRTPGERVDLEGRLVGPAPEPLALARREIRALKAQRKRVAPLDEVDRSLTAVDLLDDANIPLKRLRRYEATLHNRLRWYLKQVQADPPKHQPDYDYRPEWVEAPAPDLKPGQAPPDPGTAAIGAYKPIHPPFDLLPEEYPEPGQDPDIPKIVADRREKKLKKAESRRVAKRRKVERLRA